MRRKPKKRCNLCGRMIEVKEYHGEYFFRLHGGRNFDGVCPSSYQEVTKMTKSEKGEKRNCEKCKWFKEGEGFVIGGICQVNPPAVYVTHAGTSKARARTVWPHVKHGDGCSKWELPQKENGEGEDFPF